MTVGDNRVEQPADAFARVPTQPHANDRLQRKTEGCRVQHDLHYIDNWSMWQDLKIIVRTVGSVFGRHGS